jgi:hypothetical protein
MNPYRQARCEEIMDGILGFFAVVGTGLSAVFAALKGTGFLAWPWWLTFLPAYVCFGAIAVGICIVVLISKHDGSGE